MISFKFDPHASLIVLNVRLKAERETVQKMALDTGATITTITPQIAAELGYDLEDLPACEVFTAKDPVRAMKLVIPSVSLLGEEITNLETRCMPLHAGLRVNGLLGLNFLRHFTVSLDFENGLLTLRRIATTV